MFDRVPISDSAIWEATFEDWKGKAATLGEEGILIFSEIEYRLTSLKSLAEKEENFHCYFLVRKGQKVASSLLEISHAMPNSEKPWLKLLNITLSPKILPLNGGEKNIALVLKEAFEVLASSASHAIELIFHEHPSVELKIYGRTPEMWGLFTGIISSGILDSVLEPFGLTPRLEGKWLVFAKIER